MIRGLRRVIMLLAVASIWSMGYAQSGDYQAPKAATAPTIDGIGNDACWAGANWYAVDQLWLGAAPTAADFSGKFKVTWDADKLYVLGEVTDDVLNDNYADPLSNYWEDDTWEVFIDEDKSGGDHQNNYNAFAYHVSRFYDAVDIGTDGNPKLVNSHLTVKRTAVGNVYTWEAAFDIYTDKFVFGATTNPKAVLAEGKVMGFALAYCDNDGGTTRQSFIGSEVVAGTDKNQAYKNASYFGKLTLVNTTTQTNNTFTNVLVANNLTNPTAMVCVPDGRILVCEQTGKLRVIKNGALLPNAAVSLTVDLTSDGTYTERGLLGITLDPNFATNGYIYLFYTTAVGGKHNRVSRFMLMGDVVMSGDETIILELDPLSSAINHNGGAMNFGKDGKLYIAVGDNHTSANAQNLDTYHGKILRVNPDGSAPTDNPFYSPTATEQRKRVWSYGVRNPFTFDVHPTTGQILINDVGQDMWEEIDDITTGGKNYGWPTAEGMSTNTAFTNPLYTYVHSNTDTTGCAITGGCFFAPTTTNYPTKYKNKYFFMDFCSNWMNYIDPATGKMTKFYKGLAGSPVVVDVGSDGNLYYLSRDNSAIYKIVFSGTASPEIVTQPLSQSVFETQPLALSVAATGSEPFTYQWMKNGVNIPNATSATFSINTTTQSDSGSYTVSVTNVAGTVVSNIAKITIGPKNTKPVATITSPSNGILYKAGDTFNFSGTASDVEDGTLPTTSFTWYLDFHHNVHTHDGPAILTGTGTGSITIPTVGETSDTVWYVLKLIVADSKGLKDTATIELRPLKSTLTFQTQPAGLKISVDDQIYTGPKSILSVQNLQRHLKPISPQMLNNVSYRFDSWSQGGADDQIISTPTTNTTYTAVYVPYTPDTTKLTTVADAYVQDGKLTAADSTTAFGATNPTQLVSKIYNLGPNRRVLLRFDISNYTAEINSAKIKLFGGIEPTEFTTGSKIQVAVYTSTNTTWNENTVTWKTRPTASATFLDTLSVNNNGTTGKDYFFDVTSYIKQAQAANQTLVTFVLINTKDLFPRAIFHSKENSSGKAPQLILIKKPILSDLEEASSANEVLVYPNPSSAGFHIVAPSADTQIEDVVIRNLMGTVVETQSVLTKKESVVGTQLAKGVYILELKQNGKAQRLKIVKE